MSPILLRKFKNLLDQYQKQLLQLVRNKARDKMHKSNTQVKYLSTSLKDKVLNQDYETIKGITYKIKEKNYIKRKQIYTHNFKILKKYY